MIAKEGAEKEGDKDSSLEATYDRRNWIDPHDMFGSPNTTNHDDEDTSKNLNRNDPKTEERTNGEHSKVHCPALDFVVTRT